MNPDQVQQGSVGGSFRSKFLWSRWFFAFSRKPSSLQVSQVVLETLGMQRIPCLEADGLFG